MTPYLILILEFAQVLIGEQDEVVQDFGNGTYSLTQTLFASNINVGVEGCQSQGLTSGAEFLPHTVLRKRCSPLVPAAVANMLQTPTDHIHRRAMSSIHTRASRGAATCGRAVQVCGDHLTVNLQSTHSQLTVNSQ